MTFSTCLFWPCNLERAWAEKSVFLPFQKCFWHVWVRYNPMYACPFKLTQTRSVKISISDNFLVCGPIWVHDALFWSCWPKDSFKIILVSIKHPEKNQAKTLEMHRFLCRNAQSPNWVQVVSLWTVDLMTRVNTFLCQSNAQNKLGPKTLNVHRFPCWGLFLDF